MTAPAPYLYDRSGTAYPLTTSAWRGADGSPLMMSPLAAPDPSTIDQGEWSIWRYAGAIPVARDHRVSLGEGMTPLVEAPWAGPGAAFKLEWINPSGSFKDRGVSVLVSHLLAQGARHVLEDSSGNGGSSLACYAAAAGIEATVVVPEATSQAKIAQVRDLGAHVELVGGSRDDVADHAIALSAHIPYASHAWHPLFLQGTKTLGYELWEQSGFEVPDNVVLVTGGGSLVLGCDIAFTELLEAGLIERRPRLLVGQPEDYSPIVDAVAGRAFDPSRPRAATLAEGAAITRPVRLPEVVEAVRRSGGAGVAVNEGEIRSAVRALVAHGLYAEPTSAVAAAALRRFSQDGTIRPGERTVAVLTGSGLKSTDRMAQCLGEHAGSQRLTVE